MKNKFLSKAKSEVQLAYTRDSYMVQAVRSLDDLDEVKSLLFQRLDEWFKIHFPEMELGNEEHYAYFAAHVTEKDVFSKLAEQVGPDKAGELKAKKSRTFGAPLEKEDQVALKSLAETYLQLYTTRKELEHYIEAVSRQVMPNATALVGGLISARLLSVAGSMERLATFPASTLQVLGAEKALFKHLKKGTLPPKHGLIFQSPYVNGQPFDKRGKAARALAAKLAIALKADFYTHHDISANLLADLQKRMTQIGKLPTRNIQQKDYREMDYQRSREFRGMRPSGFQKSGFGGPRESGFRKEGFGPRPHGDFNRGPRREGGFNRDGPRRFDDRPPRNDGPRRNDFDRPRFGDKPAFGDKPRYGDKPAYGDRPKFGDKPRFSDRPRPPQGDRPAYGDKPKYEGSGDKPYGKKRFFKKRRDE
ncbi:hypothetical protein HYV43_06540 [Candidatus Micrarchaeota archaeon]|nr:hypothetical protein [Candidatus Micrarchaeota archaeon]